MAANTQVLFGLYAAIYVRSPDKGGYDYWNNGFNTGTLDTRGAATAFSARIEWATAYPATLSDSAYVDKIYSQVLGIAGDTDGRAFWTNLITTKAVTRTDFVSDFISATLDFNPNDTAFSTLTQLQKDTATGAQTTIKSKVTFSEAWVVSSNAIDPNMTGVSIDAKGQAVYDPTKDASVGYLKPIVDPTTLTNGLIKAGISIPAQAISLSVSPATVVEGTGNLVYTFTRTGDFKNTVTINYAIDGTATADDYTVQGGTINADGKTGTVTFAIGSSTATATLVVKADGVKEGDETVKLLLTAGKNYNVGTTTQVIGTIQDDSGINRPPVGAATGVLANGTQDTVYTIDTAELLKGITDPDNDPLSVANLTATNGTLNGLKFTPKAGYTGEVALIYDVVDGKGGKLSVTTQKFMLAGSGGLTVNPADNIAGLKDGNDQVVGNPATADTLHAGDIVTDASTTDKDVLTARVALAAPTPANPTITNIETLNLSQTDNLAIDLSRVTRATTLNLSTTSVGGTALVDHAKPSAVSNIVTGDGIASLTVNADATGTQSNITLGATGKLLTINSNAPAVTGVDAIYPVVDMSAGFVSSKVVFAGGTTATPQEIQVTAGKVETVDASKLIGSLDYTHANLTATSQKLAFTGSAGSDKVAFSNATATTVAINASLGDGDDSFTLPATAFAAGSTISVDGGAGNDTLVLKSGTDLSAASLTLTNVEKISFNGKVVFSAPQAEALTTGTVLINARTEIPAIDRNIFVVKSTTATTLVDLTMLLRGGVTEYAGIDGTAGINPQTLRGFDSTYMTPINNEITGGTHNDTISGGSFSPDTITGGKGADNLSGGYYDADKFMFVAGDSGLPSPTTFDTITNFEKGDIGIGDRIVYPRAANIPAANVVTVANAGSAAINANSVATFNAVDTTLAQQITAVANTLGSTSAGTSAVWGNGADTFLFISDGVAAVGTNDVLIKLAGVTVDSLGTFVEGVTVVAAPPPPAGSTIGNDNLKGTVGNDIINGLAGNDTIDGLAGNDMLSSGDGDNFLGGDRIIGGVGIDTLVGGAGSDTFVFAKGDSGVPSASSFDTIINFQQPWVLGDGIEYPQAANIPAANVVTVANAGSAAINANSVATFNAVDTTLAQQITAVANTLGATPAGTSAVWGNGADTFVFISDGVAAVGANDVLIKLVNVTVNSLAAVVRGVSPVAVPPPPGGPTIGNDNLQGTVGHDIIDALAGNDTIDGLAGNDTLFGNDGNDLIFGGVGNDFLTGGAGSDTFVFAKGDSGVPSTSNFDTINDFTRGEKIDFGATNLSIFEGGSNSVAGKVDLLAGRYDDAVFNAADTSFAQHIAAVSNTVGTVGAVAVWKEGSDAYLFVDGDGAASLTPNALDVLIKLTGWSSSPSGDYIFTEGGDIVYRNVVLG